MVQVQVQKYPNDGEQADAWQVTAPAASTRGEVQAALDARPGGPRLVIGSTPACRPYALGGPADSWQLEGELRQLGPSELRTAVHDARRERDAAKAEADQLRAELATRQGQRVAVTIADARFFSPLRPIDGRSAPVTTGTLALEVEAEIAPGSLGDLRRLRGPAVLLVPE